VSDLLQLVDKRLRGRCLLANVDQAEGLRRMLAGPKPRVFTFLSALKDNEKSEMLVNLGVSVARQGQQILMVDARSSSDIGAWFNASRERTLLDVAQQQRTMHEAVKMVASGLSVSMLSRQRTVSSSLPPRIRDDCREYLIWQYIVPIWSWLIVILTRAMRFHWHLWMIVKW
jgi:Mrp family chromosome partitioning ATPase